MKPKNEMDISGEPTAIKVWPEGRMIYFELTDCRIDGFPTDRFKILSKATDEQLQEVSVEISAGINAFILKIQSPYEIRLDVPAAALVH